MLLVVVMSAMVSVDMAENNASRRYAQFRPHFMRFLKFQVHSSRQVVVAVVAAVIQPAKQPASQAGTQPARQSASVRTVLVYWLLPPLMFCCCCCCCCWPPKMKQTKKEKRKNVGCRHLWMLTKYTLTGLRVHNTAEHTCTHLNTYTHTSSHTHTFMYT